MNRLFKNSSPVISERILVLDGLRACAVSLVIFFHLIADKSLPAWTGHFHKIYAVVDLGQLGVQIFFVISGFIITHLLIREEIKRGKLSLAGFWLRRVLRIIPPLLVFLLVVALLSQFYSNINPKPIEYFTSLTFTNCLWSSDGSWWTGHTWSLSIEEQFYLFWPVLFVLFPSCRLCVLGIVALVLMPLFAYWVSCTRPISLAWTIPASHGYLVAGCVLALILPRGLEVARRWRQAPVLSMVIILVLAAHQLQRSTIAKWAAYSFGSILGGLGLAVFLLLLLSGGFPHFAGILSCAPICWIGRVSYSLYLWQQLFIGPFGGQWFQVFPQNLLLAFGVACLSFWAVETPFNKLKTKLQRPKL